MGIFSSAKIDCCPMWLGLDIFLWDWTWHGMPCYWATVLHKVAWVELAEYPALSSVDSFKIQISWVGRSNCETTWQTIEQHLLFIWTRMDIIFHCNASVDLLKNCCPTWHGLVRYGATLFPHVGMVGLGWPHECINANRSVSWHFFIFQIFNFFGMVFG